MSEGNIDIAANSHIINNTQEQRYSFYQPIWQLIILSIVTFNLYQYYWILRNWRHIKIHNNSNIRPGIRTGLIFFPIVGIVMIYLQFRDIKRNAISVGTKSTFSPILIILLYSFISIMALFPGWLLISFLSILPLAWIQYVLNQIWEIEQPNYLKKNGLSAAEIVFVVLGSILWFFVILGMILTFVQDIYNIKL